MNLKLVLVISLISLAGCFPSLPERDCGVIQNTRVFGRVVDERENPLAGATIFIESQNQNACNESQPIADILLTSDSEGRFDRTIPLIYEDDVIRIEVSALNFRTRSYDERTYTCFADELSITLSGADDS